MSKSVSAEETTLAGNLGGGTEGGTTAPPHVGVEQLRAQKWEINEAGQHLVREYVEVDREIERRGDSGHARDVAHDINRRIITDDETLSHFAQASQNIAAATALLHGLLEAATPEDRRAHREIRTLLERAAAQQAESLLSRRCELDTSQHTPSVHPARDASVHQALQGSRQRATAQIHQRLGRNHGARSTLDARRRTYSDPREGAHRGYHPHRGGCYDSGEDRSPSPGLPGKDENGRTRSKNSSTVFYFYI